MTTDECFELGYVAKTHGLHGQVVAELDVDDPAAYAKLKTVYLSLRTAPGVLAPHRVERLAVQAGGRVLLKLRGIERIEEAEPLRGAKLWLPLADLPKLEDDQFYFHDVLGFQVVDQTLGELGVVENFYEFPHQSLLAMRYQGREILVPVAGELIGRADFTQRQLFVTLPEGLLDVYLKPSSREREEPDEFDEP